MIKSIVEEAIQKLRNEKDTKKRAVEQQVMRDKIAPYNADIDTSLSKAIQEVQANADKEKAELARKAEKTKKEFMVSAIAIENARIDNEYDGMIARFEKMLADIKE